MIPSAFIEEFGRDPSHSGFILDFDGTLSRVVAEPGEARPVEKATNLLERLSARFRVVALLSGRRADQLASLVGAKGVRYLGVYGAEEFFDGELYQPPEAETWRGMASRLARDAESFITSEGLVNCVVEYKDVAVSIHFRNSPDLEAADRIVSWALAVAPRRNFDVGRGRKVIELRPNGVSKAGALDRVIDESGIQHLVAAGDDSADVDALARSKVRLAEKALAIGVRSPESPAGLEKVSDLVVDSPSALVDALEEFVQGP